MSTPESFFPLASIANDGWSKEDEATATCFCGAVQLAFPTRGPGLLGTFLCHCSDCHKISSSMFSSNITVADTHLRHLRGRDSLKTYGQATTIRSKHNTTNYFCGNCGSLMYRVSSGFPGISVLRLGTVDDFSLAETKLRPQVEQYLGTRASWLTPVEGAKQVNGDQFVEADK